MLSDLLEKQSWDCERQQYKSCFQKSRYSIQLQISKDQAQALASRCGGAGFENCRKTAASLGVEPVLLFNFLAKEDF